MDEHTATEIAYNNGYEKGKADAAREFFEAVDEMMTCVAEMTGCAITYYGKYAELKYKYTEEGK